MRHHPDLPSRIASVRHRIAARKRSRRATADLERDHVRLIVKQIKSELREERAS